jgi:hypothetical protein
LLRMQTFVANAKVSQIDQEHCAARYFKTVRLSYSSKNERQ